MSLPPSVLSACFFFFHQKHVLLLSREASISCCSLFKDSVFSLQNNEPPAPSAPTYTLTKIPSSFTLRAGFSLKERRCIWMLLCTEAPWSEFKRSFVFLILTASLGIAMYLVVSIGQLPACRGAAWEMRRWLAKAFEEPLNFMRTLMSVAHTVFSIFFCVCFYLSHLRAVLSVACILLWFLVLIVFNCFRTAENA